jgi:2-dehydropantoate 2-reductase
MRFIVYGAGAVGGPIAVRLAQHGTEVIAIARGEHARLMAADGLRLDTPDETLTVRVPVVTDPSEISFRADDVVLLCVKTQDTAAVLARLAAVMPWDTPVVCAQNAVCNEPAALRLFPNVYGMNMMIIGTHVVPGVVQVFTGPCNGILDLGRYPGGVDDTAREIAAALVGAGFESEPVPDIMRWKYGKLLLNLMNACEVAVGPGHGYDEAFQAAREEGETVLRATGIPFTTRQEDAARRGSFLKIRTIGSQDRGGASTWQSIERGAGSAETDYLTGEIVLLGRQHGVPTPINSYLQRFVHQVLRGEAQPGTLTNASLLAAIKAAS